MWIVVKTFELWKICGKSSYVEVFCAQGPPFPKPLVAGSTPVSGTIFELKMPLSDFLQMSLNQSFFLCFEGPLWKKCGIFSERLFRFFLFKKQQIHTIIRYYTPHSLDRGWNQEEGEYRTRRCLSSKQKEKHKNARK